MIEPKHSRLSVRRQCELVGLNRASYYAVIPIFGFAISMIVVNITNRKTVNIFVLPKILRNITIYSLFTLRTIF